MISLAVGSILLMRTEGFGYAIPLQLIAGVVMTTILVVGGIFYFVLRARNQPGVSGAEGMIGKHATVVNRSGVLWVQLEGELWHFHSSETVKEGQTVEIVALNGLVLEVK